MNAPARVAPGGTSAARRRVVATVALLAIAFAGGSAAGADAGHPAWRRQFTEAGRAYDAGRMADAVRLYEEAMRTAPPVTELYYNLGNAYLRDGRVGPAALSYRKAWRLAPRDSAIDANLRAALQETGAAEADLSGVEMLFTRLSEREWAVAAVATWWATCLLLGLAAVRGGRARPLLRLAVGTAAVSVVALLGLWVWRGFERRPELVVLEGTQNALRAPLASAPPLFPLPEGSVVRESGAQAEWVEVASGQLAGWIRRSACAPARP